MNEKKPRNYYLGEEFPEIYFTQREVDCLLRLLEGHTIASAADTLVLSPRTVEFYVKNMRMKIGAENKAALIRKVREMRLFEQFSLQKESEAESA